MSSDETSSAPACRVGRPKVLVTRAIAPDVVGRIAAVADVDVWEDRRPPSSDELISRAKDAAGLLTMLTERVDDTLLASCPALRVVANMAVGYDNLDLAALTRRGIPASNTPEVLTEATADLTFALVLAAARRIVEAERTLRTGGWITWEPGFLTGLELGGSTLGVVGMGRIGRAVVRRALAFSMRVVATSRSEEPVAGVEYLPLDELLRSSDVVSLHVPLTDQTRHLIDARALALMKPTAILVNTARGPIVDQVALAEALAAGTIRAAGLDVFEREPVPPDDPILSAPNCVTVPHIGSATEATRTAMASVAADNVIAGLRGERLPCCVNPAVYDR